MRLAFFGTPDAAVPPLEALQAAGHDIALVVTQPDRRRARRTAPSPSPVRVAAERLGFRVLTPERAREVVDDVAAAGVDLGVVVAFGQLLPSALLAASPLGFVNLHFSLLPRWRGAAPVERAILAGDPETGVCVMGLEAGLDTGPVYARVSTPIGEDETAGELRGRLVALGTELLVSTVSRVATTTPEPQAGEPTYAEKLTVDEFALDWHRPAAELARRVRAANPRPGAFTFDGRTRLKVWRARAVPAAAPGGETVPGMVGADARVATDDGALQLLEVQPEGRRAMPATAWLAGRRDDAPLGSVAGA